jgi:hypothetical protein
MTRREYPTSRRRDVKSCRERVSDLPNLMPPSLLPSSWLLCVACPTCSTRWPHAAAGVMKVSPPLGGTVIWPVLADRVFLAVSVLLSLNMRQLTWFLAPSFPSLLWLHIYTSTATAFTNILFTLVIRATLLKATWILLQMTDALASLGLATAASAWANLPMTSP